MLHLNSIYNLIKLNHINISDMQADKEIQLIIFGEKIKIGEGKIQ